MVMIEHEEEQYKWAPREDFCISYGTGTAEYALLHGETESSGESHDDAVYVIS